MFFKILLNFFLPTLIKKMEQSQFKDQMIIRMNECIDIPVFSEEHEERIYEAIYTIILSLLKTL
jgi:hypothetical protein